MNYKTFFVCEISHVNNRNILQTIWRHHFTHLHVFAPIGSKAAETTAEQIVSTQVCASNKFLCDAPSRLRPAPLPPPASRRRAANFSDDQTRDTSLSSLTVSETGRCARARRARRGRCQGHPRGALGRYQLLRFYPPPELITPLPGAPPLAPFPLPSPDWQA